MRQKGIPTYTLDSVAWPDNPKVGTYTDSLTVSFNAKGGGTHGEFAFRWYTFGGGGAYVGRREIRALGVEAFTDGLASLMDERVMDVLDVLRRRETGGDETTEPPELMELLDAAGISPSIYHLQGVLASGNVRHDERKRIDKMIARQRRHEAAARSYASGPG